MDTSGTQGDHSAKLIARDEDFLDGSVELEPERELNEIGFVVLLNSGTVYCHDATYDWIQHLDTNGLTTDQIIILDSLSHKCATLLGRLDPQNSSCVTCSSGTEFLFKLRTSRLYTVIKNTWFVQELVEIFKLAIPLFLAGFLQQLLFLVSLIFVGQSTGRSLELDAAALAVTFTSVTGGVVVLGLSSASDTLSSQAYGFKNYKRVGVTLQRGILILSVAMFPVIAVWLNTESILLLLQQSPCVSRLTAKYVQIFCLALPSVILYYLLQNYLHAQSFVWPFVWVGLLANVISAIFHGILLFPAKMGVVGAAVAMVISNTSIPVLLIAYVWLRGLHKQTWGGWSWESLCEWGQFLKLGIPGLIMTICEWGSFEISTFVTGNIDETQLAVNSILISVVYTLYMIPYGISTGTAVRIGNELGAGNPLRAKRVTYTAIGITVISGTTVAVVFGISRKHIGQIFTRDRKVIDGVSTAMYATAALMFLDHIQGALVGVIRGSGRQPLGAVVNFVAFFVAGLPLGISLALASDTFRGALGMWIGFTVADMLQCVIYSIVIMRTDWEHQSQRAIKNSREKESGSVAEDSDVLEFVEEPVPVEHEEEMNEIVTNPVFVKELQEQDHDANTERDGYIPNGDIETSLTEDLNMEDEALTTATLRIKQNTLNTSKPILKILLCRTAFFLGGIVLLVAGGVASQYHPMVDYSCCYSINNSCSNHSSAY